MEAFVVLRIVVSILVLGLSLTDAHAFNWGFARVPDWMDKYLLGLLLLQLPFWLALMATKPRGVPINQMSKMNAGRVANFFRRVTIVLFASTMALFFVGMGLIRWAEAVGKS
jgi:hypothetical protein